MLAIKTVCSFSFLMIIRMFRLRTLLRFLIWVSQYADLSSINLGRILAKNGAEILTRKPNNAFPSGG